MTAHDFPSRPVHALLALAAMVWLARPKKGASALMGQGLDYCGVSGVAD
jgi:hypothetical protein